MTDITLLDGGMGQELVRRTGDRATPLWSTQVMMDHPELVGQVHDDFFAAGATVATTNTYAVLRDRLERVGLTDRIEELTDTALRAAETARAKAGGGLIAGSLGPLMASYRPDLCPPAEVAEKMYAEPVRLMKDRVDLLILETMCSVDQADGAMRAAGTAGKPVWLAVSVMDEDGTRLRSGEPIGDLAELVADRTPDAVLINCARPEAIAAGLEIVKVFGRPFGAYANGFSVISEGFLGDAPTVDALERRTDLTPEAYADFAIAWVRQGATIVGGCCEVGPAHITEIARRLRADGHRIV